MDRNRLLAHVLGGQCPLKTEPKERGTDADKQSSKIKKIISYENATNFGAQYISVKDTVWGSVLCTNAFFVYLSHCERVPSSVKNDFYRYTDQSATCVDKKEIFIQWGSVTEVMRRKVFNIF